MEESKVINNNIDNTDMSTSQSTIGGNVTTNNKFNKDDLQEVTGGGSGGIVTPPTTIVDESETSQQTGTLTPILLILGDGTSTPPDDEEPVLLEEDEDTTYNAVLNQSYENMDPTITLESGEVSYCDANYVIAVTETDKNTPINYDLTNLSFSFTNNGDNWCSVEFKSPLQVTDQLKLPLNSTNFPDYSKIIVPVITCQANTGSERNTTITFNIKNFAISHNIKMNVIQDGVTFVNGPCVLERTFENNIVKFNILNNSYYYIFGGDNSSSTDFVFKNTNTSELMLFFGLNNNNNIVGNLTNTEEYYNTLFSADDNNYKCSIMFNGYGAEKGTSAVMQITKPETIDLNQTITFKYNNITFMKVKYMDNIKYKTTIYICTLENLQKYKTDKGYIIYLFEQDIGTSAAIKDTISQSKTVPLHGDNNTDDISNGRIVTCWREYFGSYDAIKADNIGELNNYTSDDETQYQIKPVQANLSAKDLGRTYNNVYIEDWTGLNVYDYNSSTLNFKGLEKNTDIYVYTIKDNKYVKIGVINFGKELNQNNYIGQYDYYYYMFQASAYNSYWFQYIHCYGDKNDSYYNSEIETDALNSTFKDKYFGTFDLYFVVIYNIDEKYNNKTDVDIANSIINSGKTYKKYQVPSGTYQFTMNNLIALTYHPKDIQIETIKTFEVLYNELNLSKSHYKDNHFYNKYNTYNVIDLNNVCNDINGNVINLNEVCKDLENRIYIFTKENNKLVYIGVISPVHTMVDDGMANWNHYT